MNNKTKDTIIRHLKGIVAALEKPVEKVFELRGKKLKDCTDEEIGQAWLEIKNINNAYPVGDKILIALRQELEKRNIAL